MKAIMVEPGQLRTVRYDDVPEPDVREGFILVEAVWVVEMMVKMMVVVLTFPALADMLRRESAAEIRRLTWDKAARKCIKFYYDAITRGAESSCLFSTAVNWR